MPPKPDLVFNNATTDVETDHPAFNVKLSPTKPDNDLSHTHRPSAPIIEDWVSDSEDESETKTPHNVPSFVQPTEQVKSPRPSVQHVENSIPTGNSNTTIPKSKSNGKHRNRKACFVCKSLDHLIKDLLTQSKLVPITAVRPVTIALPKTSMTRPRQAKTIVTKPNSPPRWHINRSPSLKASNFPPKVTAVKAPMVNAAHGVQGKWEWKPKCPILNHVSRNTSASMTLKRFDYNDALWRSKSDKGVIDSRCSRHMTGNMSYLSDFKELNGGYVAFGGNPKGGKISRKELEFEGRKPESEVNVSPSSSAQSKKHDDKTKREAKGKIPAVGQLSLNNTNTFSAAGPSNAVASPTHGKSSYVDSFQLPDDPNMPELEDITYSDDENDVGAESDFNNLETSITKVWVLVDLPHGKRAIGTKWVFRNKKDERDIVVRNKARHVAQGHTQEEGIEYEEVFAPVARIKAIRLFLAYASCMGFMVYQMDVKSAFLYGTIEEEVYVCQPPGFEDPNYPDKVYKVVKALYGLHQVPRACQVKYIAELTDEKLASTPIDTEKPLLKNPDDEDVDVHTYRSMIGSLMYLTSSRPDIMFAVCACARFQVTPKASHLHAVKRIFRYLKGKLHLGLWYPKDLPFNLVAYSNSDYAGASLDRKSTTGGCQFLGWRLISWQCKKQIVVATSSTRLSM
nr:putative integrase [Tanacetum cinerariifolium]